MDNQYGTPYSNLKQRISTLKKSLPKIILLLNLNSLNLQILLLFHEATITKFVEKLTCKKKEKTSLLKASPFDYVT